jgi:hypothetical protein
MVVITGFCGFSARASRSILWERIVKSSAGGGIGVFT